MSEDVRKFSAKASRLLEEIIVDKRARASRKKIADPERRFHEGFADGLGRAVSVLRSLARDWK